MKLLLLALVGFAAAASLGEEALLSQLKNRVIPVSAMRLKGSDLTSYVNSVQSLWKAAPVQRSRRASLMGVKYTKHPAGVSFMHYPESKFASIPETFDARTQWPNCADSIGYIRDQSDCGSCWAFAAAECMSDRVCIASNGNTKLTLSADDILSCCGSSCGYGCEGGYPIRAWNFWDKTGVVTGSGFYEGTGCKPYPIEPCGTHKFNGTVHHHDCPDPADTPKCTKACVPSYTAKSYLQDKNKGKSAYALKQSVATIQADILANGPVEAAFTVYEDFEQYTGGVYVHTAGDVLGGHAVKILGWGTDNGTPYWLVANSWNIEWGENGFFRIIRGTNDCGIEEAIVAGLPTKA